MVKIQKYIGSIHYKSFYDQVMLILPLAEQEVKSYKVNGHVIGIKSKRGLPIVRFINVDGSKTLYADEFRISENDAHFSKRYTLNEDHYNDADVVDYLIEWSKKHHKIFPHK